jgi:hypothetical protein
MIQMFTVTNSEVGKRDLAAAGSEALNSLQLQPAAVAREQIPNSEPGHR